jgi:hypothetical protein
MLATFLITAAVVSLAVALRDTVEQVEVAVITAVGVPGLAVVVVVVVQQQVAQAAKFYTLGRITCVTHWAQGQVAVVLVS